MFVTATTKDGKYTVQVIGESADEVVKSPQFVERLNAFDHERMRLERVVIQSADFRGPNRRVLFAKFEAEVYDRQTDHPLPGIVFLRGSSVCILCFIRRREDGQVFVLTVKQPRVPVGQYMYEEIPAGMMENGDSIQSRMLSELAEEAGIKPDRLLGPNLSWLGDYIPSTGGCDELISCASVTVALHDREIEQLLAVTHGVRSEHEKIQADISTIPEFVRNLACGVITDSKAIVSAMFAIIRMDADAVAQLLENYAKRMFVEVQS